MNDRYPHTPDGNLPDTPHIVVVPPGLRHQWEGELHRYLQYGSFDLFTYHYAFAQDKRKPIWRAVDELRGGHQLTNKIILATQTVSTSFIDC